MNRRRQASVVCGVVECPKAAITDGVHDLQDALGDRDWADESGQVEVRLWLRPGGVWELSYGAIDYDQDHSGVCAETTLTAQDDCECVAVQLWNECAERVGCAPEAYPDLADVAIAYAHIAHKVAS